jgi:hypothetical protein
MTLGRTLLAHGQEELERAAREQEIRQREESARIAREKVARERVAELEEQQRLTTWSKAHDKEVQRCRLRDHHFCVKKLPFWSHWLAL